MTTGPDIHSEAGHRALMRFAATWIVLILLSAALSAALEWLRIPASLLLGSMLAGIILAASGIASGPRAIAMPRAGFELAQAIVGVMIAGAIPLEALSVVAQDWPIFLTGVVFTIVASFGLGYVLARREVLPGPTAVWGASPGAAQAMIFLAEAHGADMRLVAVMQYLRVGLVAAGASIVARIWQIGGETTRETVIWFPPLDSGFLAGLFVIAVGLLAALVTRMSAGTFLLPLLIGAALNISGVMTPVLPEWLLALAFAAIGWMIGLRFTREILSHAARALPRLTLAVLLLMAVCGLMALALIVMADVDPLTAYLATSPGGADSIAIVAANSDVDMAFVMAMQTLRFIAVLALSPWIARKIAENVALSKASSSA